jgi:Cu2+-exporting ATPase
LVRETAPGMRSLSVLVTGAYCAACIQKIETAIAREQTVSAARFNFSTRKLWIEWDGPASLADRFVSNVENLGYKVHPYDIEKEKNLLEQEERFLLLCLGVSGFAMGNIMLLSVGLWTTDTETMGVMTRDLLHWVSALIALPTVLFSGRPFFRSAAAALRAGQTNMDVPISVGLILAGGMSLYETATHGEHAYFDSAVMLIFFLLIGRYFDFHARKKARTSANDLLQSMTGFATVLEDGRPRHYIVRDLKQGQIVRVAAGEKIPTDGIVVEGTGDVDCSIITGETLPRTVSTGAEVYGGTLNLTAPIIVRVTKQADNSVLADIARLMDKAGQAQARYVRIADKVARLYTPVVHVLAALTFIAWFGIVGAAWQESLMIAITVLIITCPCALGLAVPVVQVLSVSGLMKRGILVKAGDALERLAAIDTLLLDKTGTITHGKPQLMDQGDMPRMQLAASLASYSNHPFSLALVKSYNGPVLSLENVKEYPGCGMEGFLDGTRVRLGSRQWCGGQEIHKGYLELWLQVGDDAPSAFFFTDRIRRDVPDVLRDFKAAEIQPILLSGDRTEIVAAIAKESGIDTSYGEKMPEEKYAFVKNLQSEGRKVLMIGDGLNDAPTLAAADISMAPGTALEITQNAADIVFMGDDFAPVLLAYRAARLTQKLVKQNFILAAVYNLVAIPVAALGFLTPFLAALAMSGSSLVVIINSFRVRRIL